MTTYQITSSDYVTLNIDAQTFSDDANWPYTISVEAEFVYLNILFDANLSVTTNAHTRYFRISSNYQVAVNIAPNMGSSSTIILSSTETNTYPGLFMKNTDQISLTIQNIYLSTSNLSLNDSCGWLVGVDPVAYNSRNNMVITQCITNGMIGNADNTCRCGGVIGSGFGDPNNPTIQVQIFDCVSYGIIYPSQSNGGCGGIAGPDCMVQTINCVSFGNIGDYCGGIVGSNSSATITSCYSYGMIGQYAGGIVGSNASGCLVADCYSNGTIGQYAGGIFGSNASNTCTASTCRTKTTVSLGAGAGGIFGQQSSGTASYCYSKCPLDGLGCGGIFGENSNGSAVRCYSKGNIQNSSGGIMGRNTLGTQITGGNATYCYSVGMVNSGCGGIYGPDMIGINASSCYTMGSILGNLTTGSVMNCYYRDQIGGVPDSETNCAQYTDWDDSVASQILADGPTGGERFDRTKVWVRSSVGTRYELNGNRETPDYRINIGMTYGKLLSGISIQIDTNTFPKSISYIFTSNGVTRSIQSNGLSSVSYLLRNRIQNNLLNITTSDLINRYNLTTGHGLQILNETFNNLIKYISIHSIDYRTQKTDQLLTSIQYKSLSLNPYVADMMLNSVSNEILKKLTFDLLANSYNTENELPMDMDIYYSYASTGDSLADQLEQGANVVSLQIA